MGCNMTIDRFVITFRDGTWKDTNSLQEAVNIIGEQDATILDTHDGTLYTRKDFNEITAYILLG